MMLQILLLMQQKEKAHFDILILDPPRDGSTPQFIQAIGYLKPRKVIYISCNPITLKRDLNLFRDLDYKISKITGYDNFPRTKHIEVITLLELKK